MAVFLTPIEQDQLKELVNIGAGNASVALSQMVGQKVTITVPETFFERVEKGIGILGESSKIVTVVLLKILGDAPGSILFMFSPESALKLASLLTRTPKKDRLEDIDRSALQEVGNILSGAALSALAKFLNMNILQSVPDAATDMLGSVVDSVLADIGLSSDSVLIFQVHFAVEGHDVSGQVFFLFDPNSTAKILKRVRKKLSSDHPA